VATRSRRFWTDSHTVQICVGVMLSVAMACSCCNCVA